MGAELSNFIKEQYADRPHEARLERMLMHTLSELREQMTKPTRSWRYTKNFFGGEQHHRPVDIVPEEVNKLQPNRCSGRGAAALCLNLDTLPAAEAGLGSAAQAQLCRGERWLGRRAAAI